MVRHYSIFCSEMQSWLRKLGTRGTLQPRRASRRRLLLKHVPLICLLFLVVATCVVPGRAQTERAATVSQSGSQITVTVLQPVSLSNILDELCHRTNADCSGTQHALPLTVAAQEVSGDWPQVLSVLLSGADLNYIVGMPSSSTPARLTIVGLASRAVASAEQERHPAQGDQLMAQGENVAEPPSDGLTLPNTPAGTTELSAEVGATTTSSNTVTPASALPSADPAQSDLSGSNSSGSAARVLPFPDSFGNPVSANNQAAEYLPFPDADGKPVPVSNQPAQYLPFPDADGKPVPVSNQPVQYLPFPDSNGRPIPVQPGTAH